MSLSINNAAVVRSSTPTSSSSIPVAMRGIIERIAGSSKLTLAEKLSYADALLKAYAAGDWRAIQKLLRVISMIEASRAEAKEQSLKADELVGMLPKAKTDVAGENSGGQVSAATADVVASVPISERLLQLLQS